MFVSGKQVLRNTYVKLLVALEKMYSNIYKYIYIYIYIYHIYIHTYISAQLPYIVSNSKTCMTVGNQKTKLWYLKFHALWQSSVIIL